jgi:hypothetical protein
MYSPALSRRTLLGAALALSGSALMTVRPAFATQTATPVAATSFPASLLDRAYDPGVSIASELAIIATFADLEAETIATGVTRPAGIADEQHLMPWLRAMYPLALPSRLGNYALDPRWVEFTGFDITQVDQAAEIGEPPEVVSMYTGRFDRETILGAWKNADYQEIQTGNVAIWSISEDESFSIENPVQQLLLSAHNNAAMIGDDLIIFAARLDLLKDAVAAATGEAPGLGQNPLVAELLSASPTVVSGALVSGGSLLWSLDPSVILGPSPADAAATAIAEKMQEPQFPPILLGMIGITGGGPMPMPSDPDATPIPTPETATMEIALLMPSSDAAANAIAIAEERLETMDSFAAKVPYRTFFPSWDGSVAPDAPVALLSLELGEAPTSIWTRLLFARDLGFIG